MSKSSNLRALQARVLILDVPRPSNPRIMTMISIWESLRLYFLLLPSLTHGSPVNLPWDVQETLITRGKQVISKMHLHASQLMELYGEQYVLVETDHERGISIRFRTLPQTTLWRGKC